MEEQTSFFSKKRAKSLVATLTIVWFILFSINCLCSSIIGAVTGKYWSQIDPQDRFVIVVSITMNWTGMIMAFLYQAVQRVKHGGNPLIDADESTTVTTTTETKVTPPADK